MRNILIIFILGVSLAWAFAAFSSPISGPDMVQYDQLGLNLADGHGFSMSAEAPYAPTMYREPLYPIFLAFIYKVFGHHTAIVVFVQILLHALTAVMAYLIAEHIFSKKTALISGLLVAVFPTLANMASYILCETLFTFELCLGILVLLVSLRRQAVPYFALGGIIFGCLTLTRTIVIFLPFIALAATVIMYLLKGKGVRRIIICCISFIIVYMAVVSIWPVRNKIVFNTFSMAGRGGMVIWSRAEKLDDSPREILATATCSFSEYLGKKVFPDIIKGKSNRYFFKDLEREMALEVEYAKAGVPPGDIDKLMAGEAFQKIALHPVKYVSYTFIEWLKMTAFTYIPFLNEEKVNVYFSKVRNGDLILALVKGTARSIAYILLMLVLIAMIKNIKIWDRWIIPAIVIIYINLMYSLLDAIGRYAVPLIPLYCILAASVFFNDHKGCNGEA